jgi:hypothetical protein
MLPRMSDPELILFRSFQAKSARYLEFGCGGSTVLASANAKEWIVAVDSSEEWLQHVAAACATAPTAPELVFADIGKVGDWGYPVDPAARPRWAGYHSDVFQTLPKSRDADFIMVDGRFRVACFAQAILHCPSTALIGFHDFQSRPQYHVVRELGREIAAMGDMSIFAPLEGARERAIQILDAFRENPA